MIESQPEDDAIRSAVARIDAIEAETNRFFRLERFLLLIAVLGATLFLGLTLFGAKAHARVAKHESKPFHAVTR